MRQVPTVLLIAIVVLCGVALSACGKRQAVPSQPLTDAAIEARARSFVEFTKDGKYAEAVKMLSSKLASALPADRLKSTWESIVSKVGAFESIAATKLASESEYKVVYVTCKFKSANLDVKAVFDAAGIISGLWFGPPQAAIAQYNRPSYVKPDSFAETDCEIGSGKWILPATLTMPKGDGPFPAVVLVHGSGPHDRDETIGPNKPFKDLAWGLASNGVAVLRYEKRTRQYAQDLAGIISSITVKEETVDDALEAAAYLRQAAGIDPSKVFIVGHSLGASMAPRMVASAKQSGKGVPAGLVMMAPYARPLLDLSIQQYEYLASLDGQVSDAEKDELAKVKSDVARIKGGQMKPGEVILGAAKAYWDDIIAYDPVATAKSVSLPLLILQGERDYQVTMEDFSIWQKALGTANNAALQSLPGLNHLFVRGEGKPSPEEYNRAGNIDASVIDAIVKWVKSK